MGPSFGHRGSVLLMVFIQELTTVNV